MNQRERLPNHTCYHCGANMVSAPGANMAGLECDNPECITVDNRRLRALLRAVQTDAGNWLHSKLQDRIEEAVGAPGSYRGLDDPGV